MSYDDHEYHRRRAEAELENAVSAESSGSAIAHLELARMHRAKRLVSGARARGEASRRALASVFRTDKEG